MLIPYSADPASRQGALSTEVQLPLRPAYLSPNGRNRPNSSQIDRLFEILESSHRRTYALGIFPTMDEAALTISDGNPIRSNTRIAFRSLLVPGWTLKSKNPSTVGSSRK